MRMDAPQISIGLLRPGGVVVMIDMNDRFPLFRSQLKKTVESPRGGVSAVARGIRRAVRGRGVRNHDEGSLLLDPTLGRPGADRDLPRAHAFLNATVRSRAMRSLVVARKPA